MEREEVLAKIIEFAALAFKADAAGISEDTVVSDLGVSSAQRVTMSASIENEFDVMIPVARFGKFKTIGEITDFVMDEM